MQVLGLADQKPPALTHDERRYLAGFLTGIATATPPAPTSVPVLPTEAPVGLDTVLWINGLLAGTFSRLPGTGLEPVPSDRPDRPQPPGPSTTSDTGPARPLLVLWASQTGNAEDFGAVTAERLSALGRNPSVLCMADCTPDAVPAHADLLVVTSTFGDGDAPDVGITFWESLAAPDRPSFDDVRYAVLAPSATPATASSVAMGAGSTSDSPSSAPAGSPIASTVNPTTTSRRRPGSSRCSPH